MSLPEKKHAVLAPSKAHQWHACNGSIFLTKDVPDKSNIYAAEGTAGHTIAAGCLNLDMEADEFISSTIDVIEPDATYKISVTDDLAGYVQTYVGNIRKKRDEGRELHVEVKVPIDHVTHEWGATGTADAVLIGDYGSYIDLSIEDLKLGREDVSPVGNLQEVLYYAGVLMKFQARYHWSMKLRNVSLTIHQPKIQREPKVWVEDFRYINQHYVLPMRESARRIAFEINDMPTALKHLSPGEKQCRWCLAKDNCPALAKQVYALAENMFQDETLSAGNALALPSVVKAPSADHLPLSDIEIVVENADMVRKWLDACEARLYRELTMGANGQRYKLVTGNEGQRKWADETAIGSAIVNALHNNGFSWEHAVDFFQTVCVDHSVKSPPQMEKALKKRPDLWQELIPHIHRAPGKPVLVKIDDERAALTTGATFDDETESVNALDVPPLKPEDLI